ncbi:DUF1641 domain-containing protein [Listeria monocytogenes]|nr:DUF1641 domain-containing protein [Listeria monocytogenes]EHE4681674.1 DUF1641 domain-containing protein [Listeria monocytogenes]EHT4848226.1 DUF1641 domain-containing protein [Listeria monocytogenes]EHT7322517.1 DUF1641 domain-containing protein [Listeria monocytogenes]
MAEPISTIRDTKKTPEELEQERLEQMKADIAEQDSGFVEIVETVKLLQESGALEALNSAIKARGDITKTFLNEWRKEPMTNAINNMMISSKLLIDTKPEQTEEMIANMKNAAKKAEESAKKEEIMGMLAMMKALKDPDINRALRYGITFLKEVGQTLK